MIRAKIHTRKKALWIALYRRRRFVLRSLAFSILCLGIDCSKSSDLWLTMRTANVMIMTTFNVRRYFFALCLSIVRLCVCFFLSFVYFSHAGIAARATAAYDDRQQVDTMMLTLNINFSACNVFFCFFARVISSIMCLFLFFARRRARSRSPFSSIYFRKNWFKNSTESRIMETAVSAST